jgi:hypothetical protein
MVIWKMRERYLPKYYIPISIALTALAGSYERYRAWVNFEDPTSALSFRSDFEVECLKFLDTIEELMKRGADAYLISDLDEKSQSFRIFLAASIDAEAVRRQFVLNAVFRLPFVARLSTGPIILSRETRLRFFTRFRIGLGGILLSYSEQTLAAPLESREFERRFQTDITVLKGLVKEVTLGSRPS